MSVMKKTVEQLWLSGHSEDFIVKYVSIVTALKGNFCLQTSTIQRHVRSEIARLKRKGLRPNTDASTDVAPIAWCSIDPTHHED